MYTLIKELYTRWNQKPSYSILIIGLESSGKTTFLEKVKCIYNNTYIFSANNIIPTVGQNIGKITVDKTKIQLWDLGGRSSLRSLWYSYFSECHSIILVVDSSEKKKIQEAKDIFEIIANHENIKEIPILILANKQDVSGSLTVEEIKIAFNNVTGKLERCKNHIMPSSAINGEGVQEAIEWLKNQMEQNTLIRKPIYC
ncbi:hypothetical protein PNEG_01008 [Pneumocystis murina B123]|uniref:ADP-ribosylation factor-like protein 3 n=1 Tax=Pneumocystis murina (strain B123) TaxID=1069680 RepID=M7NUA0_PNEMU|nr:hypothetical protein PNEG_01008 [Pneumocystis murina B123]EMR10862.1 hypothetical protein PNEG_01008 [Pneumocystis murina B123]